MFIEVCIGSSCHIKGSHEIVELMQNALEQNGIIDKVTLSGSFCTGKCNRDGVTVTVDGEIHTGITPENFNQFFSEYIAKLLKNNENSL